MSKLTKTQQKKYRPILLDILQKLGVKLERLEEAVLLADVDTSVDDGGESGAEGYSRDFQLGLIENEDEILQSTRLALERIENGIFGTCMGCKELIPARRLEVVPYAPYCVGCQELSENGELELD